MKRLSVTRLLTAALLVLGVGLFGKGVWIYLKAQLAQVLLEQSWAKTMAGESKVRPWPWADTWPVARIVVPKHGIDQIVLAGANGRAMAFGPGHVFGSAPPGEAGNTVIGAHRDTHFEFLQDVSVGDQITLEDATGDRVVYRVTEMGVVDQGDLAVLAASSEPLLTLITCYPFDAVVPGGPLRYVVKAVTLGHTAWRGDHRVSDNSETG